MYQEFANEIRSDYQYERRWDLVAKQIFGDITPEELQELELLNKLIPKPSSICFNLITQDQYVGNVTH